MRTDHWYDSRGGGRIHYCRWAPEGTPKGVLQIIHGIGEYVQRYDTYASWMANQGFLVVAEDHMGHGQSGEIPGYFTGGWQAAVEDSCNLLHMTRQEYPDTPYILLGHSMGSFMARTILSKYPDSGIQAAVIMGTCWQSPSAMAAIRPIMKAACKQVGETNPSEKLQNLVFGTYNARVEHVRTSVDWVCRDKNVVDAHPMLHGFQPTAGLLRDMMEGLNFAVQRSNLETMNKALPVLFVAGGDDPVGNYGKGVRKCAESFREAGMQDVKVRIYPMMRHEILNEINKEEVFEDILQWIQEKAVQ